MRTLNGKCALITGSSRGIGQQIALGLARLECNVVVHARRTEHLERTLRLLEDCRVRVHTTSGDLGTLEGIQSVVDGVRACDEPIDILYNNAATMNEWKTVWEIGAEEWLQTFQVNFFAMVALCNAFAPAMRRRDYGRIINVTSGIKDTPNAAPYSASKAAVDKYTRDLAAELRDTNVLVNRLDPGWLRTDLGGPNADFEVDTVLPGALVPALLEDSGPSGRLYRAQDFKYLG